MADEEEAHGGALGDTDEVHDTIHPGDLPLGHPSRPLAEEKLAEAEGEEGVGAGGEGDAGRGEGDAGE